jgi:acyl dehydratase
MSTNAHVSRGFYYEEFVPGQVFLTAGRTVTEADIVAFAALSGDWNPMHTDAVYASQHLIGQRVAHGLLGLSIASALAVRLRLLEDTFIVFRQIDQWKFSLPIFIGDTVHASITISDTRPVPRLKGGLVTFAVELLNQNDQIVQHGEWTVVVKSKTESP